MVFVLNKGADKKDIAAIEHQLSLQKKGGFDAKKFNGAVKIKGDALKIQKKLRNEWNRDFS